MRRRGFLLPLALLISAVMLILGLGLMSQRVLQYRGSSDAIRAAQVRAVAMAGLEDAREKLRNDLDFPPPGAEDQQVFSYSEDFFDPTGVRMGSYTVSIDSTWVAPPYAILRVSAVGYLDNPAATRTLTAELDLSPTVRGSAANNPDYFRWINLEDRGSL